MNRIVLIAVLVASVAFGAEFLLATLSGAQTQTLILGRGASRLAIQCTTPVRYTVSAGDAGAVTANDALIATGDPYIIDKGPGITRLGVAHQDTTTSISCSVFSRVP